MNKQIRRNANILLCVNKMIKMRELLPEKRVYNFNEVMLGYNEEEAIEEANRCLECKKPPCVKGCPVGVDIPGLIKKIKEKDFISAYKVLTEKNIFPSICGRVCPAEYQCHPACIFTKKHGLEGAIGIQYLERFIGDYGMRNNFRVESLCKPDGRYKVGIVGSGPAGLSCASELIRNGVNVTIFESLHLVGGVLRYGIPKFRLSREVLDYEINYLKEIGVEILTNYLIGRIKTIRDLFNDGYNAIFIGTGAGTPLFLDIPGENLCNIYTANEYLTRVNLMHADEFPKYHTPINVGKNIVVIGGSNTAMDAARVALRLQKINNIDGNVKIVYRRTESEMPARKIEIEHAKEEGVEFQFLTQPIGFIGDENGYVKKMRNLRCELGEPDKDGRRKFIPIKGSEFEIETDTVIIAIGFKANQTLIRLTPELKTTEYGDIIVNSETMETSIPNVYAGGDAVGGEGTVIEAMSMGKTAAKSILSKLQI